MADTSTARPMPAQAQWLRANLAGKPIGVDRENRVIRGVIAAEEGPFKTPGRGEFDLSSLQSICELMSAKPAGLKSRWTHPTLSADGLGCFLGRAQNGRLDTAMRQNDDGSFSPVSVVRVDLAFDPSASNSPTNGDMAGYLMDLAESDPDAFATSLVLQIDEEYRTDDRGRPELDPDGNQLPPLWRPKALHGLDVVDTGDATNSFLSADILAGLPDAAVREGAKLLDTVFAGQTRDVVAARAQAWLGRYLDMKFGEPESAPAKIEPPAAEPEQLATFGGLTIGDIVQWWGEDDKKYSADRLQGMIVAVGTSGPLEIAGTDKSREGNPNDPVALIYVYDDDDELGDEPDDDCQALVMFSQLDKVVIPKEDPGTTGYSMSPEDESWFEEIELREREAGLESPLSPPQPW